MALPAFLDTLLRPPDARPRAEIEVEVLEEIEFHLEMRTRENIASGMAPSEAEEAARHRFGSLNRAVAGCLSERIWERVMLQRINLVLMVVVLAVVVGFAWSQHGTQRDTARALEDVRARLCARGGLQPGGASASGNSLSQRTAANEAAAVARLKSLTAAQAQFRWMAKADVDGDGDGEYGCFAELSGGRGVRGDSRLSPPFLPEHYRNQNEEGVVRRDGYCYRVFLPGTGGTALAADARGFDWAKIDTELAERMWCAYAWPQERGKTGTRTFFTSESGHVYATDWHLFSGHRRPVPRGRFVLPRQGSVGTSSVVRGLGGDGSVWRQVD